MSDDLDFEIYAKALPAADIKAEKPTGDVYAMRTFPIRIPNEDREDFVIEIRASQIVKSRRRLQKLARFQFPTSELLLGVASLLLGATFGSLVSDISLLELRGIWFFIIFPIIGCSALVAYFFLRRHDNMQSSEIAEEILSELPDPSNTSNKD
jgi:hypothetical protein